MKPTGGERRPVVFDHFLQTFGNQVLGDVQRADYRSDQLFFFGHVEQLEAGNDLRHNTAQRPYVQAVVQTFQLEANFRSSVRDGLKLLIDHGVCVLNVKRPAKVDDLH